MEILNSIYRRLIADTKLTFKRYLYDIVNWDNRLIIIRGAKGVGKTTMMLQRIKEAYPDPSKAFYASLDNIWFGNHTIFSFAEHLYARGVETLFLDEVHKYPDWKQEVKNIYDSFPNFNMVITGSSMFELTGSAIGDLSRRARLYTLHGLSLREFLTYDADLRFEKYSLDDMLSSHIDIAASITNSIKIVPYYEKYLKYGYYPFYKQEGDGYYDRLMRVIDTVIEAEIPAISGISYSSVYKIRKLLSILSERTPYTLNISDLSKHLQTSRENITKLFSLMSKAALTFNMYSDGGFKALAKPTKILFDNTNIMCALSSKVDGGTQRETMFSSQLKEGHTLLMPNRGDFLVDGTYLFEVGGKKKSFSQIKDINNSYVVSDDIEIGYGNKIPLWLFGFLY